MFTGIVEELGSVKEINKDDRSMRISVAALRALEGLEIGASIAVNGACLTVVGVGDCWFSADVTPETISKTGFAKIKVGDRVNVERALRLADRLGGHIVTGHIDGTGLVSSIAKEGNALRFAITAPKEILRYMVVKGSVALDGVSLTIARVGEDYFEVSIIPLTAKATTFGLKKVGEQVNIESDLIGKYLEKMMTHHLEDYHQKKEVTLEFLMDNGFI